MDYQTCIGLLFLVSIVAWINAEIIYYRSTKNDWIIVCSIYRDCSRRNFNFIIRPVL